MCLDFEEKMSFFLLLDPFFIKVLTFFLLLDPFFYYGTLFLLLDPFFEDFHPTEDFFYFIKKVKYCPSGKIINVKYNILIFHLSEKVQIISWTLLKRFRMV